MTIDNHKIVPKSARFYAAIGGGFGVKMNIHGGRELLFGQYAERATAELIVARANRLNHNTTVEALERGEREQPMGKQMIEVRVMLTAEEAREFDHACDELAAISSWYPGSNDGYTVSRLPMETAPFEKIRRAIRAAHPITRPKLKLTSAA